MLGMTIEQTFFVALTQGIALAGFASLWDDEDTHPAWLWLATFSILAMGVALI